MLPRLQEQTESTGLRQRLCRATAVTPQLMADVVAAAGSRLAALPSAKNAARLRHMIEAEAWMDAALTLLEVELPQWKLRRLLYEDGAWFCSLSEQPDLPLALDDSVDAGHAVAPLALLVALLDAKHRNAARRQAEVQPVPYMKPAAGHAICCDNFA